MRTAFLLPGILLLAAAAHAQYEPPDPAGFEGIIVEKYYVADAADAADLDGSAELVEGAVTYRVFVDLLPGYKLLTVGGFTDHPITFSTTTTFYNNDDRGEAWGTDIPANHLNKNTVAIDSWLTIGAASTLHWGVLKADDPDGSLVGGANNDGGSNGVPGGLLINQDAMTGVPLTQSDGLWLTTPPPATVAVGTPPDLFDPSGGTSYSDDNFAWAVLGGVESPDPENRILIGQFTTDGVFTFCLNMWVRIPDSLVCDDPNCHEILEFYGELLPSDTAGSAFNTHNKFTHPTLCFSSAEAQVDCEGVPGGSAQPGTPCDDGDPNTPNDLYLANCECAGEDCQGINGGPAMPGTPCDDGNAATIDDTWTTTCLCEGVVSVAEHDALAGTVSVRPNPVHELLFIAIEMNNGGKGAIQLKDATGRTLRFMEIGEVGNDWNGLIEMASYASGVYFVEFAIGDARTTKRIVKH